MYDNPSCRKAQAPWACRKGPPLARNSFRNAPMEQKLGHIPGVLGFRIQGGLLLRSLGVFTYVLV